MARFCIESVKIEGFKGFNKPQIIPFEGKYLFLFGENGSGKSSIIEAIRWCLSGGEREELLRNQFFSGACQVELSLRGQEGLWRIRRRLRPGSSRSDVRAFDPQGQERGYSEVFLELPRLISGEGACVVLAEQHPLRRRYIDVSRFDRVVYASLGLDEVKDLYDKITNMLEEYEEVGGRLYSGYGEFETKIRGHLDEIEQRLNNILANPPWEEGRLPTKEETYQKILRVAFSLAEQKGESLPEGSSELLLDHAERLIRELETSGQEPLERKADEIREHISRVEYLWRDQLKDSQNSRKMLSERIAQLEGELRQICEGRTLEELKLELDRLNREIEDKALRADILKKAERLAQESNSCPVCCTEREDLLQHVCSSLEGMTSEEKLLIEQRDNMQRRYEKACELVEKLQQNQDALQSLKVRIEELISELCQLLSLPKDQLEDAAVEAYLERKRRELSDLEEQMRDIQRWAGERRREIRNLREESHFQKLREKEERLRWWLTSGRASIQEALAQYEDFLRTTREVKGKLYQVFRDVLERVLSPLSELMTEAYQRLTHQASFDQIQLKLDENLQDQLGLSLRVGSQRVPDESWDPEDVLNGQALNAIRLVPYFVFHALRRKAWNRIWIFC